MHSSNPTQPPGPENEPIAIVGSGCRFPGDATTPARLWALLREPRDVLAPIPPARFSAAGFYHEDGEHGGHSNVRDSYVLAADHTAWDAGFFNISAGEAAAIDPQQRLLMECVYEALEAGGHGVQGLRGSDTAVYVGLVCEEYSDIHYRELNTIPRYFPTGTARSIASNRISYFFDWRGPSMTIDTACSSSLVAVNQAVQALRTGVSRVAVAAGAQLILGPEPYIVESAFHMLSPSGRCRMWDASADGYGRGDGVAAVVLKTLSQAVADGDRIECVIREIGVNQDGGATSGITVPNPDAQVALIRDTYRRAGLDLTVESDRPQFFECHGTGTPTGDPLEAQAIHQSLGRHIQGDGSERPLYVGSIKTVIGHTEATAGIAGLLKASLAVQGGLIPPNLLLDELNPAVRPFYGGLKVPVGEAIPWPATGGGPRRVSVNSFGFGGTNAHAIVESYDHAASLHTTPPPTAPLPYVFSAETKLALKRMLGDFGELLADEGRVNELRAHDVAFTLNSRRSVLPTRAVFAARGLDDLGQQLRHAVTSPEWEPTAVVSSRDDGTPRILGIFAGQGAQWAGMARHLLQDVPSASQRLAELEGFLADLPDAPSWSLREELSREGASSRLHMAEFAQPACTALQILQADLLRAAGVALAAVVGHSSGEVGAAYAAGMLSARDAMAVAYYRGVYSSSRQGAGTEITKGAMMAAGMGIEEAREVLLGFRGRVTVAAHNSPTSVTLSGDEDAILLLRDTLTAEGKFARLLRVDRAYHSHHMQPCLGPYTEALRRAGVGGVAAADDSTRPTWYSSVFDPASGKQVMTAVDVDYWARNMGQPVLFADAVEAAVRAQTAGRSFSMAVGVGPHGALRGPLDEIVAAVSATKLPYADVLSRNTDDSLSLMKGIGRIWAQHAGLTTEIDLGRFQSRIYGLEQHPIPPRDLPPYPWDHTRTFWHESRRSRALRTRPRPAHPLLGTLAPDSSPTDLAWHNLLRVADLPWLRGHRLQGQVIYPAAGYVAAAVGAALQVAEGRGRRVRGVELRDVWVGKAIVLEEDGGGVEVFTTLSVDDDAGDGDDDKNVVHARFRFRSTVLGANSADAPLNASGRIVMSLMDETEEEEEEKDKTKKVTGKVHGREPPALLMDVDEDHFYSELKQLGYHYTGAFRSLSSARRKLGYAQARLAVPARADGESHGYNKYQHGGDEEDMSLSLLLHPGPLDALFQAVFLAYAWPGDGRIWSMHVPVAVDRIEIDLEQVRRASLEFETEATQQQHRHYMVEADITMDPSVSGKPQQGLGGDVGFFLEGDDDRIGLVVAEGVRLAPLATASPSEDVQMFLETVEAVAFPDCTLAMTSPSTHTVDRATEAETELGWLLERIAHFYLARLAREITPGQEAAAEWHHQKLMAFARHAAREVAAGRKPYARAEWAHDIDDDAEIKRLMDAHRHTIDVQLMRSVGENLAAAVRRETVILQHMVQDGMLNRSYEETLGVKPYSDILAKVMRQIVLVHPGADVLEIGAGTGGATKRILNAKGQGKGEGQEQQHIFGHYTFTDVSSGFFEAAASVFAPHVASGRMSFRTLDIERDPVATQDFPPHAYDVVVASFVLHATSDLAATLRHARRLLRPGGFLVLLEMTSNDTMRLSLTMGGLEGWWLGAESGRPWSPCVSAVEWHRLLRGAGFTGVEQCTPELDPLARPFAVLVSRAEDSRVRLLLEPSSSAAVAATGLASLPQVLVIAGSELASVRLAERVAAILQPCSPNPITIVTGGLGQFDGATLGEGAAGGNLSVLYLADLDARPLLDGLSPAAFEGLKKLFALSPGEVLWVTRGAHHGERPYAVASVGLGRALMMEHPEVAMQFVDFSREPDPRGLADELLRLRVLHALEGQQKQQEGEGGDDDISSHPLLWNREPEVYVDADGRRWVARIVPHARFNEAYNSARRAVSAPVDLATDCVEVYDEVGGGDGDGGTAGSRVLVRSSRGSTAQVGGPGKSGYSFATVEVRPRYTVPLAVQAGGRTWHVSLGFTTTKALSSRAPPPPPASGGEAVLVLSDRLGSVVTPASEGILLPWGWDPPLGDNEAPSCLGAVANALVASLVAREAEQDCRPTSVSRHGRSQGPVTTNLLLLLEPDVGLAREVSRRQAGSNSWKVISLTTSSESWSSAPDVFTLIDPHAGTRTTRKCLGLDARLPRGGRSRVGTVVIGSSPVGGSRAAHSLARFLQQSLPEVARARVRLVGELLEDAQGQEHISSTLTESGRDQQDPWESKSALAALFGDALDGVRRLAGKDSVLEHLQDHQGGSETTIISLSDYIHSAQRPTTTTPTPTGNKTAIIDWSSTPTTAPLTATARPLDSTQPLLRGDRTYLLLGLGGAGGLGSSLAEYLVRQGARHILLTSRNPGVDPLLTATYARQGVRIEGAANDITHEPSLRKLIADLRESADWPPIGGVANGAMVLADVSLANMGFDQMARVLRPKVEGSILLDRIFSEEGEEHLDFFVLFSSLSCVLGNRGQANYDAANMFLVGLAAQRRARGAVASVVDIGAIMGMGYMAREVKDQTIKQMVGAGFSKMSERDFLVAFAHAVLAGRAGGGVSGESSSSAAALRSGYEVITGLHVPPPTDEFQPGWVTNPRFSPIIARSRALAQQLSASGSSKTSPSSSPAESTRDLLRRARTTADVEAVVTAAVLNKVTHMLQLGGEVAGDREALLQRGTAGLGVDSLVAVEMRAWMLRELEVDMPVFRILADAAIRDMVAFALEALPEGVTPCLDRGSSDHAIVGSPEGPGVKAGGLLRGADTKVEAPRTPPISSHVDQPGEAKHINPRTASPDFAPAASTSSASSPTPTPTGSASSPSSRTSREPLSKPSSTDGKLDEADNNKNKPPHPTTKPQIEKTYPISYGQSRFWLMSEIGPGSTACNIVNDIEIRAELDKAALSRAVAELGRRHEALRTAFIKTPAPASSTSEEDASWDDGLPRQAILKESPLRLEIVEAASQHEVDSIFQNLHGHEHNLETGELVRMVLVSTSPSPRVHHLVIGYHHINMDSASTAVLVDEMLRLYAGEALPPPAVQQAHLAVHERAQLEGGHWDGQLAFWREQLQSITTEQPPPLAISPASITRPRPPRPAYRTHSHGARIQPETARRVRALCRGAGVTPFHFYTAVLQVLLARLSPGSSSEASPVVIGTADGGRGHGLAAAGADRAVGNFLNIVPLVLPAAGRGDTIRSLLRNTRAVAVAALGSAGVPFEVVAERAAAGAVVFRAFIDYKRVTERLPMPGGGGGEVEGRRYLLSKTPYDVFVDIIDTPEGDAWVEVSAQEGVYTDEEAGRLLGFYVNLVGSVSRAGDGLGGVDEAEMFDPGEVEGALRLGQGDILPLDHESILPRLAAAANSLPNTATTTALEDTDGGSMTWAELASKSASLARLLTNLKGVGPGSRVGIFQEPSVDWVVSMLAVWRAGASYVPLDPAQGPGRLAGIVAGARLSAVLVHGATASVARERLRLGAGVAVVGVEDVGGVDEGGLSDGFGGLGAVSKGGDEAVVLYTSGTTGEPKGISIPHRTIVNGVQGMLHRWPELARQPQTVLQQSSISFDLSWWTVLLGLSTGGKAIVAGRSTRGDPRALTSLIAAHRITLTVATPSETLAWLQSVDDPATLRSSSPGCAWSWHVAGGEPFPPALSHQLRLLDSPGLRVVNAFGPAECWMPLAHEVRYHRREEADVEVPLGSVMPNYTVRVVDEAGRALPPGIPGQLVIGGAGVARGYDGMPELTARRFPRDRYPVPAHLACGWDRVHLSGDRGYLSVEGEDGGGVFRLLGRIDGDTQVKLRGQRVDLRDVEASILAQAQGRVSEAVATVRGLDESSSSSSSSRAFIVAHVVLRPSEHAAAPDTAEFLRELARTLPLAEYMRPTAIVPVETLPLTPNGKLDRRAIAALPVRLGLENPKPKPEEPQHQEVYHHQQQQKTPPLHDRAGSPQAASDLSLKRIRDLWQQALASHKSSQPDLSALGPHADFFHVGGNSILLTRVQTQLRRQYGLDIPLRELFHSSTLGQMALLLERRLPDDDSAHHGTIDWDVEAQPPPELALAVQLARLDPIPIPTTATASPRRGLVVALTGATGFLGRHILARLAAHAAVAEVHCLAVRSDSGAARLQAELDGVPTNNKKARLVIHRGDLTHPDLGLSPAAAASTFAAADVILHNGADTSFLKSYATLRAANLDSLRALVRLSLTHRSIIASPGVWRRRPAHIHLVSTAGVATFLGRDLAQEGLGVPPPRGVSEGYLLTKWAGEMLAERCAAGSAGLLRATVHRPTALSGEGAPELDVVASVVRYAGVVGAVPALEGYGGAIQFVGVGEVAGDVVAAAVDDEVSGGGDGPAVRYVNHCGDGGPEGAVRLDRLGEYLRVKLGRAEPLPVLPDEEWIARAEAAGFPKLLGEYLRADTLGGKRKTFRILLKG